MISQSFDFSPSKSDSLINNGIGWLGPSLLQSKSCVGKVEAEITSAMKSGCLISTVEGGLAVVTASYPIERLESATICDSSLSWGTAGGGSDVIVVLTCREMEVYRREVEVNNLYYNQMTKAFSMSYCWGDSWGMDLECPLKSTPFSVESVSAQMWIRFERKDEVDSFAEWLTEGEDKVQEGFRTMRG